MSDAKPALFAIAAPLLLACILAISAGALWVAGWRGRDPVGARAAIHVDSDCPVLWKERLLQRAGSIGLGEAAGTVDGSRATLVAILPGLEDDAEAMPALLTQPGRFAVFAGEDPAGEVLATEADIVSVDLGLNLKGHPYVQLGLQPTAVERLKVAGSPLTYVLDGEVVDHHFAKGSIRGAEIRLQPRLDTIKDELRHATDWNIVLRHGPAPCPPASVSLQVLD
jgi:hypothetical protein